jgi:hypothetical protein
MVPGSDEEQGDGIGANAVEGEQAGGVGCDERTVSSPGRPGWPPGNSARRPSSRSAMRVA